MTAKTTSHKIKVEAHRILYIYIYRHLTAKTTSYKIKVEADRILYIYIQTPDIASPDG